MARYWRSSEDAAKIEEPIVVGLHIHQKWRIFLAGAFAWGKSPQGYDYWKCLLCMERVVTEEDVKLISLMFDLTPTRTITKEDIV
jgi:hypothetical protein